MCYYSPLVYVLLSVQTQNGTLHFCIRCIFWLGCSSNIQCNTILPVCSADIECTVSQDRERLHQRRCQNIPRTWIHGQAVEAVPQSLTTIGRVHSRWNRFGPASPWPCLLKTAERKWSAIIDAQKKFSLHKLDTEGRCWKSANTTSCRITGNGHRNTLFLQVRRLRSLACLTVIPQTLARKP